MSEKWHLIVLHFFSFYIICEFEECVILALSQMQFQFRIMFLDFLC